ncbi:progressive ankylosis protein homolog isoform X4 [Branchiostoma floridae x Branchiostoma japonicum]
MEDYLRLAKFMVPLACTTIATDIGEQALNRGVAFSENVTASYGLAFSLTKFMTGTLQQNRHIGLIMVQQAQDGRRAVALTAAMGLVVAAVHLLIALTPLGYLLIERAHQVDSVVGAGSRRAMLFLTAFPLLDGLAYVFIGMLLQYHHSLIVGASSIADVCVQVAVSVALMETALQTSDPLLIPILALYTCSYSGYVLVCLQVAVSVALMETALQTSDPLLIPILALYACSYSGYVICLVQVAVSLALMETALQTTDPLLIPILALYTCSYSGYVICLVQVAVSLALMETALQTTDPLLIPILALYTCSYSGYVICLVQVAVSLELYACSYSGYVLVCLQVAVSVALMETALQTTDPLLIPILALYACSYSGYVICLVQVAVSVALMETALQTTDPLLIPILALYAAMAVRLALIVAGFLYKVGPKIRQARPLADKDSFTVVRALKFWWPLALVTAVNRISRPIINLLVARELGGSDAVEAVAVLTVTYPIGHLPYAWLNEMKSLAPAFRKSGQGRRVVPWRTLWKFSCICLLLTLAVSLVLFYVPGITFVIMTGWIETSANIARLCRKPLQIFTFVAVPVSIRAYLTSWLMVQKRTWILTPSAIFRTVALVTALLVLPKLSIRGADMGIAALLTGFLAEVSVVAVGSFIVRRRLRNPAQTTDGDNTETEGPSSQCHDEADRPMLEEKETSL